VRTILETYGMSCRVAKTGTEALDLIRTHRPDAAVLHVNMPGMDGYLVLAAIREERLPVQVILRTALRKENDITRAFTLGADDYIVKTFNQMELVARLRRLLKRAQ
jgi:DNA-binding response OmpR family regulator